MPITSNFYGLPKIHKSKQIKNAVETQKFEYIGIPNPSDLKFKPIVPSQSCPTNKLSKLIDILIQLFLNKILSYIRYNIDFLNSIPEKIDTNTLIVTFNVTNLYCNIPYELGKQAITFWIDKYPDTLHPRCNKKFIIEGIEIILNNKSFQFNNINYIHTLGTAMGTKMVPIYATLILAYLEENLYEIIGKKYSNDIKEEFTKSWKRYLDDCF